MYRTLLAVLLAAACAPALAQSLASSPPEAPPSHLADVFYGPDAPGDTVPDRFAADLEALLDVPVRTASRYEQTAREAPASVTVVTADEIARYGYRSLHEILATVPGFYVSYDRNYVAIGVRGFGTQTDPNNRFLLLLDGQPLHQAVTGGTLAGAGFVLDPERIERVEVVHGPGSVVYGTGALLAVVNVITREPGTEPALALRATGGTGLLREGTLELAQPLGRAGRFDLAATWGAAEGGRLYFAEFDQPENNRGFAEGMDWMRRAGFDARLAAGSFALRAWGSYFAKGIPTGAWNTVFNDGDTHTKDGTAFAEARYARTLSSRTALRARFKTLRWSGSFAG